MKRNIITTQDGSKTIRLEEWNEHYHSTHGALQEAKHVYIKAGLDHFASLHDVEKLRVLEAGFGSGLNALLASQWAIQNNIIVDYLGLEAYPITQDEKEALDYNKLIDAANQKTIFDEMHNCKWEQWVKLSPNFKLKKLELKFSELGLKQVADVVFYDAFGPRVQPELWEASVFERFYEALKPGGLLVTYSVKGTAKRALQGLGFRVEILEGPPGKRHMMRATKPK
ncbi:tRNA (5-methylaminomethyl-2-thiouridine)(34)-methyltransferase MnmD [Psychroflexus tropicus]|uniref:tRNA (5-methylaminomethyl-2-thiouridine)(34)-methyltransferase MnmD n=1 Tax=Psychroflexus tropicus TaxID=197345 RepID=UPI00037E0C5D|nr:tRNA (5-methylaminomethyl-2-thiouridine)(34)-methyltransferase MnmD [Psychroflexus tropicus]